ncbi:MAG TPA: hypothetical protein VMA71_05065 [Alloacidobacterium sp.]|nr:hypothetical protein [Alloacidobacterium sp.]
MSLDDLAIYVSNLCVMNRTSLDTIARRYNWPERSAEELLQGRRKPTSSMLRDLAAEFDIPESQFVKTMKRPERPDEY